MGSLQITHFFIFIVYSITNHHTLAISYNNDCDDTKIRDNIKRLCKGYPSLKRSADRLPFQDYYSSPDTALSTFPQNSVPYNSEIQSYKSPILPGMYQPTWTNLPQPQPPMMQDPGPGSIQMYQQPSMNPNDFGFSQNSPQYFPQNFQPQPFPESQNQNRPLVPVPPQFNEEYIFQNVLSWLGNFDAYSLNPLARARRDHIYGEVSNFIKGCCADRGCPFPGAYINLDKRISMCMRG